MSQGLISVDDALAKLLASAKPVADVEEVPTLEATKRVLARPQRSTMNVPPMDNSAMDGFAVRISDLHSSMKLKVGQKVMAGRVGKALGAGPAARSFTRAPVPAGPRPIVMW